MSEHHGKVWWTELMTRKPDAARDYYAAVCGWSFQPMDNGGAGYQMASLNGAPVAGIMDISGPDFDGSPDTWFSYFAVSDIEATVAATTAAGGRVIRAPWDIPGIGRVAILVDPSGAAMGMMTPAPGR